VTPVVPAHGTIRSGRDIARIVRSPRQRAGRLLVVHADRRGAPGGPRVAVIASRRVGGAVRRNRAKRLLREAVRHLPLRPGTDVVLVARHRCGDSTMNDVHAELEHLAAALGLVEVPAGRAR
jgi:ribonuclease P protein component